MRTRWPRRVVLAAGIVLGLASSVGTLGQTTDLIVLPDENGDWSVPSVHEGWLVSERIRIEIVGVGWFNIGPEDIATVLPDLIQPGHFSIFDVLVALGQRGDIELDYHYDASMATHVIDALEEKTGWWYQACYSAGWFEKNAQRMDQYLVKDETTIRFFQERTDRRETLYQEFREEVERLEANDGRVVISRVIIEGPRRRPSVVLEDVVVRAHDTRSDLYTPGTMTALDILLSLGEQGHLDWLGLRWYEWIFTSDPVDHYFVEEVQAGDVLDAQAYGTCGFVDEVGSSASPGFSGSHIHIPTDVRVLVSPEYALWFSICL